MLAPSSRKSEPFIWIWTHINEKMNVNEFCLPFDPHRASLFLTRNQFIHPVLTDMPTTITSQTVFFVGTVYPYAPFPALFRKKESDDYLLYSTLASAVTVLDRQHDDTDYILILSDSRSTHLEHFHAPCVRCPPNNIPFSRSYIRLSGKAHLAFCTELN